MKTTRFREAADGEFTVYYTIDPDGGDVEIKEITVTTSLSFWDLEKRDRDRFQKLAEDDADRHEADMRGGEDP